MSIIHNIIKIKYSREGYLPNWPYHLISDIEMCDAFMGKDDEGNDQGYFFDNYPLIADEGDSEISDAYNTLTSAIQYHLDLLKKSDEPDYVLPDWIYTYMLGNVISINSPVPDIHDLLVMLGCDNLDDIFTPLAAKTCYQESKAWINKLAIDSDEHRPPTIFGEPHVIKSLRLAQLDVLGARFQSNATINRW